MSVGGLKTLRGETALMLAEAALERGAGGVQGEMMSQAVSVLKESTKSGGVFERGRVSKSVIPDLEKLPDSAFGKTSGEVDAEATIAELERMAAEKGMAVPSDALHGMESAETVNDAMDLLEKANPRLGKEVRKQLDQDGGVVGSGQTLKEAYVGSGQTRGQAPGTAGSQEAAARLETRPLARAGEGTLKSEGLVEEKNAERNPVKVTGREQGDRKPVKAEETRTFQEEDAAKNAQGMASAEKFSGMAEEDQKFEVIFMPYMFCFDSCPPSLPSATTVSAFQSCSPLRKMTRIPPPGSIPIYLCEGVERSDGCRRGLIR